MSRLLSSLSVKLENAVRRALAEQAEEMSQLRQDLLSLRERLDFVHHEVFDWCGELSAKAGGIRETQERLAFEFREQQADTDRRAAHYHGQAQESLQRGQEQMLRRHVDLATLVTEASVRQEAKLETVRRIAAANLDHIFFFRRLLIEVRRSEEYHRALMTPEPLVTIPIATYNRAELLMERALASVRAQTYERLEVVVVGDGVEDDTEDRVKSLCDDRIRFVNLPHRGVYPSDPTDLWRVAGTPAANLARELANGSWIAPLDEDDEFSPAHVEVLLERAQGGAFELTYGALRGVHLDQGVERTVATYPPKFNEFNFGTALYMGALRFFEFDPQAWVVGEPGDWQLCRRMLEAGVKMGWVDEIVTTLYPTGPRHVDT